MIRKYLRQKLRLGARYQHFHDLETRQLHLPTINGLKQVRKKLLSRLLFVKCELLHVLSQLFELVIVLKLFR